MSDAYISEYARAAQIENGQLLQVGEEPALAQQHVVFALSTQSAAFNAKTKFVRIHVKTGASYNFGTSPTATTSTPRMAAGATEFFGVRSGDKVAFVDNV